MKPVSEDSTVYLFDAAAANETNYLAKLGDRGDWNENFKLAKEAMATGEPNIDLEPTMTQLGYLASAYVPVKDHTGTSVAVVGVDFTMDEIQTFLKYSLKNLLVMMALLITGCFLVLLVLVNSSIISPVRILKNGVEKMADGELGVQVPIKSRDEIGEISEVFNRMSFNIGAHIQEIMDLNDGYYKFVPSAIFEILGKKSIKEINLGDNRTVPLEVLRMQINNFEEKTRQMDAGKLFGFLNRVYQLSVPVIMEKDGVVDSYFNGGLSAIYTKVGKNALDSAISICQKLNEEKKTGRMPEFADIELALAISIGSQMVGIVGHDRRLSEVTLSEQISMVDYLRKVAGKYKARILVTGTAVGRIPNFDSRYHARILGMIHVSATDSLEKIYDVYDGDDEALREIKEYTKQSFEDGVKHFMAKRFYEARRCFVEVLKVSQGDYAAREYLYLCNKYYMKEDTSEINVYIEDF
ncbi:MAG: HAMP domain-containing protein [Clostridium sp.]|nr:HAMP domain-containing protein [Clostridium sp.]